MAELLDGSGQVALMRMVPGSHSTNLREEGFKDTLAKEFPGIEVVAEDYCMADHAKSLEIAENFLTAHPELDGIFGSTENAGRQEEAAGTMPLPLVNTSTTERGLTASDSAWMGGGGRSSTNVADPGHTLQRFPLPPRTPQKGDPHPGLAPCPTNPIAGSFLDWKMLYRRPARASRLVEGRWLISLGLLIPLWEPKK